MEYENEFKTKQDYDREGRAYEKKIYNKNACNNFEFDNSISKEDYSFGALCQYFQLVETEGNRNNYYIMLDGERIDLG